MLTRRTRKDVACSVTGPKDEAELWIRQKADPPWAEERFVNADVGRGVFLIEDRPKGSFLLEYAGELVTADEGNRRENIVNDDSVYRYFFTEKNEFYCVDATEEVSCGPRLGRLCNHAKGGLQSAKPRIVMVDGEPHVCLFATKRLTAGLQILYDYGVNIPFQDKISCVQSPTITDKLHRNIELSATSDSSSNAGDSRTSLIAGDPNERHKETVVGYVQPVVEATGTDECRVVDVVGDVEAVDGEAVSDKIDSCASSINGVNPEAPLVVVDLNEHRKECVVENVQTVVLAAGTQLIDSCHSRVGEFNSTAIVVTVELPLDVNECQTRDVPESVQSIPESVRNSISNSCSSARDVGSSQTTVGAVVVEVDSMTVNVNECETNDSDHGPHLHVPLTGDNMEKPSQLSSDQDDVFADAELEIDVVDRAAAAAELQEPCDFSDDNGNIESDDATDADMMTGRKRSRTGQRKYDKLLACFFCHKLLKMKMKRHLISVHRDEPEVTEILQITDEKEKALEFSRLVKRGNFLHNASVLSGEPGELIVGRQVQTKHDPAKYLPCVHCQTLLLQHDLYRHVKKCSLKPLSSAAGSGQATSLKSKRHTVSESRMFLFGAVNSDDVPSSDKFRKEILGSLHHDNIAKVIKKDDLIIRLGMSMHERHGKNRVHDICQQMRQLGRLLIEVNALQLQKNAPKMTLSQCITGSNFDTVVQATRNLCTQIDDPSGRPLFKSPSIGLKLGHHLVRCAEIKKGMAIRADCIVTDREAESFLALHKAEWTGRVSSASLATLKSRRYNCPDELPLTADLTKLKMYQDQQLAVLTKQLAIEKSNYSLWKTLMEVTYSRLVIFNKRRCGETAKLTVAAFQNRPRWEDCASDQLTASLKPVERKLLSRMDMVHLPGKGTGARRVPLLLTPNVVRAMNVLMDCRNMCGIPPSNVYFFALPSPNGYVNGWQIMDRVAKAAGLQKPHLIHSTALRKYIATVTQITDLSSGELKWLANHMGHEVNIHEQVYRIHDSTIELAKISKLLMAVDCGKVGQFAGKKLDDIDLCDIPNEEADSDSDTEQLKGGTGPSESNVLHSSLHEHDASSITRSSSASKDVVLRCASQVLARSKSSIEQSQFVRNRKQPKVEKNPAETNVSHSSRHKRDKSTVVRPSSAVENETLSSASQASSFKPSNFKRNRIVDSESDVETCEHQLPCMSTKGELVDDSLTFSSEAVSCATQRKGKRKHGDGLSRTVDYDDVENTDQLLPKSTREKLDTMRSKKRSRLDLNDVEPDDVEPDDDDDQYDPSTPNNKKFAVLSVSRTNTAPKSREKWNDEEMMALRSAFHDFLGVNKYPGWKDIIDAQQVFPVLKSRSKEIIKARFVHLKKTGH